MKKEILGLRKQGYTYNQIVEKLKCSKSLVAYYCNNTTKEKAINCRRKRDKTNFMLRKIERFKGKKIGKNLSTRTRDFQRRIGGKLLSFVKNQFTVSDVLEKIGAVPKCYLTGTIIDLQKPKTYSFDHIVPACQGGSNSLDNLGLIRSDVNYCKHGLSISDFLDLCKEVLEYNGYKIMAVPAGFEPAAPLSGDGNLANSDDKPSSDTEPF